MQQNLLMNNIQKEERPYEKCLISGPGSLTDAELLAVILRCGTRGCSAVDLAEKILQSSRGHPGLTGLYHLTLPQLCEIKGVGQVKAIQILCIGELSRRIARTAARRELDFQNPESIAEYYMETMRHEEQENLVCMMLDTRNHLLGEKVITRGTVNASLISPRELFLTALSYHAVHLILLHNHPGGDPSPSLEDQKVTRRIVQAGELIGITVLDHIIIGDRTFFSLRQNHMM